MRLRWRRWWLTYTVYPDHVPGTRERAGPYLTQSAAVHAARSIWRDQPAPCDLRVVKER